MRYNQYKFKFYLNANHSIYIEGLLGERHPHTWEIAINVLKERSEFIQFSIIEEKIESWISKYQDCNLNEVEPFDKINPTLENCCDFFKERLREILEGEGWILLMIEMSETPTRSYVVNLYSDDNIGLKRNKSEFIADEILHNIFNKQDRTEG